MGRVLRIGGLVAVLVAAVLVVAGFTERGGTPVAAPAFTPSETIPVVEPVEILRDWQHQRARAWATADVGALRALYVDGSTARSDVRMLRAYARRNLVVEGIRHQLLAARVVERRSDLVRLVVTQRLAAAQVRGPDGRRTPLPRDRADQREVTLVSAAGVWRMARIE